MSLRNALLLCLCLCVPAMVSCSDRSSPAGDGGPGADAADGASGTGSDVRDAAVAPVVPGEEERTRGGDGSQIALRPLSADQLDGVDLPGELACGFADAGGATLLLARADVLPDGMVFGVLNNNGSIEMLGNGHAGGFNDLLDGISLTGKGLAVELQRGEHRPTDNEATQHAAVLKVQRADGAERNYDGTLTCGP